MSYKRLRHKFVDFAAKWGCDQWLIIHDARLVHVGLKVASSENPLIDAHSKKTKAESTARLMVAKNKAKWPVSVFVCLPVSGKEILVDNCRVRIELQVWTHRSMATFWNEGFKISCLKSLKACSSTVYSKVTICPAPSQSVVGQPSSNSKTFRKRKRNYSLHWGCNMPRLA